ncbi:MAG: SDR family oxidoreductase [Cytophagales bacterium]|nr:SDR family oxidoreductase [Bernardetiaceae bacterium]MDW8203950.1 SDR family oxidoreductase [Cytophagales bacterium]
MQHLLAVITGGSRGIGKAIAEQFAAIGFNLVLCSRNQANVQAAAQAISNQYGVQVHAFAADLSEKKYVGEFANFIHKLEKPVDVLVNNTGIFMPGQIHNEAEGILEQQIATNLYSAYHLTRALLPAMMERREGHIFNICSTASITAYTNGGSYCISKFALLGMSKVLRQEMKPYNIRVTAILPGATLTDSWAGVDLPESRFMPAQDIGKAVVAAWQLSKYTVVEELLLRPQLGDIE